MASDAMRNGAGISITAHWAGQATTLAVDHRSSGNDPG